MLEQPYVLSALILLAAVAASGVVGFLARSLNQGRYRWQRRLRVWLGVAPDKRIGELFWLVIAFHLVLWPLAAWGVMRAFGLLDEARRFAEALLTGGFKVGTTQIVPAELLVGLVWFVLLFTFTRWLKRKIEFDWLIHTSMEPATREATATLFGYATFIIALVVGLSAAGLDFSKLAIVAGALSVGIGFGLQNIVNNFVSGLILLFERPIRSGDYVFVGQTEGFVRRLSIRSTVLETWDHELIIVPNAEFLSNHVKNLNLNDNYGRVILKVGVAYGSDTALVKRLLIECGSAHEMIIREDEIPGLQGPVVIFMDFGDSALQFELRVFVRDVTRRLSVLSDLRFAVDAAFREHGVEIPFPQRDVWIRSAAGSPPPDAAP
jgi:potassium-dependent mechanosensitive channel